MNKSDLQGADSTPLGILTQSTRIFDRLNKTGLSIDVREQKCI